MKKTLKAGTIVKIQGVPVELTTDVEAESANWELIENFQKDADNAGPSEEAGSK